MKILMAANFSVNNDNPYLFILKRNLAAINVNVVQITPFSRTKDKAALHIQWLEFPMWGRLASRFMFWAKFRAWIIVRLAKRIRKEGKPVVWTVHNLKPHDYSCKEHQIIYDYMLNNFLPEVTDIICMSENVKDLVAAEFPLISGQARFHIVRHPNYIEHFKNVKAVEPKELIDWDGKRSIRLGAYGMLRPYKSIPSIVEVLKTVDFPFSFVIAGEGPESEICKIKNAIAGDKRFLLINRRLSDQEILGLNQSCDLVLFNFISILNSGSVIASVSMGRPVLAPLIGAIVDLKKDVGDFWIKTFDKSITKEVLSVAVSNLPLNKTPNLELYSPSVVANAHARIYTAREKSLG